MSTNKKKRIRASLKEPGDFLKFEPYKSIINVIRLAPIYSVEFEKGLETKELRYLIVNEYTLEKGKGFRKKKGRKTLIEGFKKDLEQNQNVKLNQNISKTYQGFNKYLEKLDGIWIDRKNGLCSLSERHKFELMKLRQRDIITNSESEYSICRPSSGHSYSYYVPNISREYLIQNVKDLDIRIKKVEESLKKAQEEWLSILADARDSYLKKLWDMQFLQNKDISIFTKFDFCLDLIFDRRSILLLEISPPEKTPDDQWSFLMDIKKKAFEKYLRKKYPAVTPPQLEKIQKKIEEEYKLKNEYFDNLSTSVKQYGSNRLSEHIIVIDFLGFSKYRYKELVAADLIKSISLDKGKSIGELYSELKKSSERDYPYDSLENEELFKKHSINSANENMCVKLPFFKSFFRGFEKDLKCLGFRKDDDELEEFYKDLDETSKIFKIPALPENPDDLLQKNSFS
jgi:hypothetical protein